MLKEFLQGQGKCFEKEIWITKKKKKKSTGNDNIWVNINIISHLKNIFGAGNS
jgi:hypothetical protein